MRVFRRGRKDMAWAAQSNRENLRSHFDAEAGGYLRRWQRFPWSALRDRETAAIRRLLGRLDSLDVLDLGCGAGFHTRLFSTLGLGMSRRSIYRRRCWRNFPARA